MLIETIIFSVSITALIAAAFFLGSTSQLVKTNFVLYRKGNEINDEYRQFLNEKSIDDNKEEFMYLKGKSEGSHEMYMSKWAFGLDEINGRDVPQDEGGE